MRAKATGAEINAEGPKIQAVTATDVKRVANRYLREGKPDDSRFTRASRARRHQTSPRRVSPSTPVQVKEISPDPFSPTASRRDRVRIARRFNAARDPVTTESSVPKGRMMSFARGPFKPSLQDSARFCIQPGVKTPGYFRLFLRNRGITFLIAALLIGSSFSLPHGFGSR